MGVLLDASAPVARTDADDPAQQSVSGAWATILAEPGFAVLTTLTLLETPAVLPRRLGMDAVAVFCERHLPLIDLHTVETPVLLTAADTWLAARRHDLSPADVASVAAIEREGLTRAFTLAPRFAEQGFECIPEG